MREVADGVFTLPSFPPHSVNAWLAGDVLIDAQTRRDGKRILKQLAGRSVSAHALTHAHPDHQGATHHVCEALGIPLWVGEADADAAEDPRLIGERQPDNPLAQFFFKIFTGPGHPVARKLVDGDEVAGFRVVEAPGHSAGHVVYWRESDRVLIAGDVVASMDPLKVFPRRLQLPRDALTPDPATNRASVRALAELGEPSVVLVGHGPPWRDGAAFRRFCQSL